ncbi:MAG: FAD-dependent oxidoreductase [Spirochaetia bacterium]
MAKPIIFAVDDEAQVLNAVERDLRGRFGSEYRIAKALSGEDALKAAREFKRRGGSLALFLVDQRMPAMSGTEFLAQAIEIFPGAKKVLLTAYADTQAAIMSINKLGLDHYLMKPWDPPEKELFPVLEDLLSDWAASHRPPFEGIRVLGTTWSAKSHAVKDFLSRNQIPYLWMDVEKDEEARQLLRSLDGQQRLPAVLFPDGRVLSDPGTQELAKESGLQTTAARPFYDLIISGGGPAGLAAAVYAGSEGLRTVLVEKEATGGQAGTSSLIENYLGFPRGLSGGDLARRATIQAKRFGVEIVSGEVVGVRVEDPYRYARLADGTEISCHALLIATGVSVRKLDLPGADRLTGAGIYYGAATSEALNYKGQDVMVVGGANSAGQGAIFLSRHARTVFLVVRGATLEEGMSSYLVEQIKATENIHLLLAAEVTEVSGESRLESVTVVERNGGATRRIPVGAMFVFIGATAHTDLLRGVVERDSSGFILTGRDIGSDGERPKGWNLKRDPYLLETNVPGIFAAGDVRHMSLKRVGSAVGEGAIAVALIHQYLKSV